MKSIKILLLLAVLQLANSSLVVQSWKRKITLMDQTPVYHNEITILNKGTETVDKFQIAMSPEIANLIGNIGAEDVYGNMLKLSIEEDVKRLRVNDQDEKEFQMVNIEFHEPLSGETETTIHMPYVLYGHYEFLPDKIDLFVFPLLSYNFFRKIKRLFI